MANFMPIEQVSWSDDGRILAIADLSDRISIKRISEAASTEGQRPWRVHDEFKVAFPGSHRHIRQLLFQPKSHKLLAISALGLFEVDADTRQVQDSSLPDEMTNVKWISHPTQSDYLLAFGDVKVRVFAWNTRKEIATLSYSPALPGRTAATSESQHRGSTVRAAEERLGKIISCADSPDVILEIMSSTSSGQPEAQYLMFTLSAIDSLVDEATVAGLERQAKELCYRLVAPEIASRIREPLALLSRGRFVFLDVDRWVCTWRTPTAPRRSVGARTGSEAGLVGPVEPHYFLPGDWVTAVEARLCTVVPDGTLLCPRNGDVASVQCVKLRK